MAYSIVGTTHLAAASAGLLFGAEQLIRTRRDALHRRLGYVFVAAMAISNVTALTIYKFTGGFNVFHALALYNIFGIIMALRPMLKKPWPLRWRSMHYQWMAWSYAGLCAAAATEFLARMVHMEGWLSAAAGTTPVMIVAGLLIPRFAPAQRPVQQTVDLP